MFILPVAHGLVLIALAYLMWRKEEGTLRKIYWPALIFKLLCGIALGLVYTYYYSVGDTFSYYKDGMQLAELARADWKGYLQFLYDGNDSHPLWSQLMFTERRALFLSKITSVLLLMTGDHYYIVSLYYSFLSFCGAWTLVKVIRHHWPQFGFAAMLAFLFFPSVTFWSSGVIKESLAMAALYFLAAVFITLFKREKIDLWTALLTPVSIALLWILKYYYAAVFLPVALSTLIVRVWIQPRTSWCHGWKGFAIWLVIFLIPLYGASVIHPNFYPERFMDVIVSNNQEFVAISDPGDLVHFNALKPTVGSLFMHAPKALLSGLFAPFIWQADTFFQVLVSLENLLLLVLLLSSWSQLKYAWTNADRTLVFSVILYVTLLCILLTLSTPNFGTLSRYRVGYLPFFILLVGGNNFVLQRLQRALKMT